MSGSFSTGRAPGLIAEWWPSRWSRPTPTAPEIPSYRVSLRCGASFWPSCVRLAMPRLFNGESDIDQADVCERLREISQRLARPGVYLFSKQANVIAKRQQMIELTFGLAEFASQSDLFKSPKAADPKCPLVATQSINTGFIALKQPVSPQSLADEVVGRSDAR